MAADVSVNLFERLRRRDDDDDDDADADDDDDADGGLRLRCVVTDKKTTTDNAANVATLTARVLMPCASPPSRSSAAIMGD